MKSDWLLSCFTFLTKSAGKFKVCDFDTLLFGMGATKDKIGAVETISCNRINGSK